MCVNLANLIQQVQMKLRKGKYMIGAAAGRYHSVFFTRNEVYSCGLNAGQLGKARVDSFTVYYVLKCSQSCYKIMCSLGTMVWCSKSR